ncbi:20883_t:CDS:2, partial [Entrophospora sp. SA101]
MIYLKLEIKEKRPMIQKLRRYCIYQKQFNLQYGSKIAEEIPTDSEEKTLKEYEQKILESTKYLVEAFLIDEKATDMSSRIMNLAQQYEKLSKLQWGDENEKKENDETSTTHEPEFTK